MPHPCSSTTGAAILYKLHVLSKEINTAFSECTGVSQSRMELLQLLYGAEDERSQNEIQKALNIDNAAVTRHLQQLEANGTITRRKKESDNRVTLVRLTGEGKHRIAAFQQEKDQLVDSLFAHMGIEEQQNLLAVLNDLEHKIKDI